ncbi:hypothetical protein [Glaciihabitans sp. UYNi722]|uniref:phage distal tail protein n=1 Tax=Glaciihabitans sp. UYNi722 TaxID=3156344 RepID=UPI0033948843
MTTTVTIGGLTFAGDTPSSNGFFFNGLADWYSITSSKSPINERPQSNGAFGVSQDWRTAATISLTCCYLGNSRADVQAAKSQMSAALSSGRPAVMSVTDIDGTTTRVVSIRAVTVDDDFGRLVFDFTIDMIAPDPLRYGLPITSSSGVPVAGGGLIFPLGSGASYIDFGTGGSSGRISVTNSGTAPVFPPFDVSGGLDGGFVVTDVTLGKSIRFERQIPLGSLVSVNQRTGRATINGPSNDVSGSLTSKDWFSIGPGETHAIQFQPLGAVTGTPMLTVQTSPAFY